MSTKTYESPGPASTTFNQKELSNLKDIADKMTTGVFVLDKSWNRVNIVAKKPRENLKLTPTEFHTLANMVGWYSEDVSSYVELLAEGKLISPDQALANSAVLAWVGNNFVQLLTEFLEMRTKLVNLDLLEEVQVECPACNGKRCFQCNQTGAVAGVVAREMVLRAHR